MDMAPRQLSVFKRVPHTSLSAPLKNDPSVLYKWNAQECSTGRPIKHEGLGYEGKAAGIPQNESLTFTFGSVNQDSVEVEICLVPTHPIIAKGHLRFILSLDENAPQEFSYETVGRSEEWKENVLNNVAIRRVKLPIHKSASHKLTIKAIDEGVILDRIIIY